MTAIRNTEKSGSLIVLGPKIWNALPGNIKKETSFSKFKEYIKSRSGPDLQVQMYLSIYKIMENQ